MVRNDAAEAYFRSARLRRMRGTPWRLFGAAALTAMLLDLPFPIAGPLPGWRTGFAWLALVPLLVGLAQLGAREGSRSKAWRLGWSFVAGWLCGALWFGANCYWVYDTMHLYGGMNEPMAALSLVLFSLFLGVWFGGFALAVALLREASFGRRFSWLPVAAVPVLWVAMEFTISRVPSFPWDELGYSQIDNGLLMRLVPFTGVMGVSFVLATANALLTAGILYRERVWEIHIPPVLAGGLSGKAWGVYGLIFAALGIIGFKEKPRVPTSAATAMLIQPNLDVLNDDVWVGGEWDRQIAQYRRLGADTCRGFLNGMPQTSAMLVSPECDPDGAKPALIVFPESPAPFRGADPRFQAAVADIVKADGAPMIVGNIAMETDPATQQDAIYNSGSVVALDGHVAGRYDKIHLVPFGEYVPARQMLFFVHQLTQQLSDLGRGTERKTFRIVSGNGHGHRYGIFICYESVFGDEVRQFVESGAEVLVNISDDGWYGDTSAPWQHLNMARMRAIENRRWILRDTNSGVTAAIDPWGTVRQSIPRHQTGALSAEFAYSSDVTFYTRHGDWLGVLCAILSLGLLGIAGRLLFSRSYAQNAVEPAD